MPEPLPTLNPSASDTDTATTAAKSGSDPNPAEAPRTARPAQVARPAQAARPARKAATDAPRGGQNIYGFCSLEKFCNAGSLTYTHDDVQGFYNYIKQFNTANFWYQDAGVAVWLYYEPYDHWQDTYGMDAVKVFYHSGHGGMGSDGTFYAPMGSNWNNQGCTAYSSLMEFGDERLRYLFWSTCLSLRVLGGHTPIRTWQKANKGARMIFGFETVSYDNPNYGKFFFEEWKKNKSFSQAWLDASWRISHNQAPSVCACGATQAEAQNRLFNERLFSADKASTAWWWWRWYNTASAALDMMTSVPTQLQVAQLAPVATDARALFDRFELSGPVDDYGAASFESGERALSRASDGSFSVRLAAPNLDNEEAASLASVRAAADQAIGRFALASDSELVLDRVIRSQAAGATESGSGEVAEARTTETIVQYRQTIDGIPVISPDAGTLRVAVDNDGNPTRIESALREVAHLSGEGRRTPPRHPEPAGRETLEHADEESPEPQAPHEAALAQAAADRLRALIGQGAAPLGVKVVPATTEIGYAIRDDVAELVATQSIEVDFGRGYRKLYRIEVPVFG